jgi:hypothetical protein
MPSLLLLLLLLLIGSDTCPIQVDFISTCMMSNCHPKMHPRQERKATT